MLRGVGDENYFRNIKEIFGLRQSTILIDLVSNLAEIDLLDTQISISFDFSAQYTVSRIELKWPVV